MELNTRAEYLAESLGVRLMHPVSVNAWHISRPYYSYDLPERGVQNASIFSASTDTGGDDIFSAGQVGVSVSLSGQYRIRVE
jgi:hypothetical protein